jgi:hypothetical protein
MAKFTRIEVTLAMAETKANNGVEKTEKKMTGCHKTTDSIEFYFISNPATGLWKSLK